MGVGPGHRLAAAGPAAVWVLGSAVGVCAPIPLAPRHALALAVAAAVLLALPRAPAALLAVVAAPLWLAGLGLVGALGPAPAVSPLIGGAALASAVVAVAWPGDTRPRALLLAGLGLLLAARAWLAGPALPEGLALVAPLALGGLAVAGAARAPRGRAAAGVLLVAALVHLGRGLPAWRDPPTTAAAVARAARLDLLDHHRAALLARDDLALAALRARPRDHALAAALLPRLGVDRLLHVGWQPAQAPLEPDLRVAVARALDRHGRGGEALRLLWADRAAPTVAWTYALLARAQGDEAAALLVLEAARPPADARRAPGTLELGWEFLAEGSREVELHLDAPTSTLRIEGRGEGPGEAPRLELAVDGAVVGELSLPPPAAVVALPLALAPGPHRLRARFVNDHRGPEGDRNAWLDRVVLR